MDWPNAYDQFWSTKSEWDVLVLIDCKHLSGQIKAAVHVLLPSRYNEDYMGTTTRDMMCWDE